MSETFEQPEGDGDARPVRRAKAMSDWSGRITWVVAQEVRRWRVIRELSAQQLSDRTARLGYRVPRSVIANLENQRRDTVGVAEVLILAAALDVPPSVLIAPVGWVENLEILPEVELSAWKSRGWILGAVAPGYDSYSLANWQEGRRAIALFDIHRLLVNEHQQIQNRIKRLAEHDQLETRDIDVLASGSRKRSLMLAEAVTELAYSVDRLRQHRSLIEAEGFVLPELPPVLAGVLRDSDSAGRHHAAVGDGGWPASPGGDVERDLLPPYLFDVVRSIMRDRPDHDEGRSAR